MGIRLFSISFCVLLAGSAKCWANSAAAFGDELLSARSIGQGQVGVAGQSEDPAVVYFNPAAMTNLPGTQASVGASAVDLNGKYRTDGGVESKMDMTRGLVPHFSLTQRLSDGRFSIGLAAQAPYGFKSNWPETGPLRYAATQSRLYLVDLSPAAAWQITHNVSIGFAADYLNAYDVLQSYRVPNAAAPDGTAQLSGQGTGWGFHGGLLVTPSDRHAFGVSYHSAVKLPVGGTVEFDGLDLPLAAIMGGPHYETAASVDLFIPSNVQFGYAFRPTERWMLEVDTAWFDWDNNRDANIRFAETDPVRLAVLNTGNPKILDRRSAWSVTTGANYHLSERWQVRGGFGYVPHATPEWTFQPSVEDLSRYGLCVGAGLQWSPRWSLDVAWSTILSHTRHIGNNTDPSVNGTYSNVTHLAAATITLRLPDAHPAGAEPR